MVIAEQIVKLKPKYRVITRIEDKIHITNDGWYFNPGKITRLDEIESVNKKGNLLMKPLYCSMPTKEVAFDYKYNPNG